MKINNWGVLCLCLTAIVITAMILSYLGGGWR